MPVTRGKARQMESQVDDVEVETSQQLQETQDEQHEPDLQESTTAKAPVVDFNEMSKQLTKTLKHLLTTHRQLENDAAMIQAGIDELHRMQEARAKRIGERLKGASSTILTFGDANQGERIEQEVYNDDENIN